MNHKAYKVVGGGETGIAMTKFHVRDSIDHISTGGGAMLDFMAGKELPGLKALGYYHED
jgi:phosphoglycerate kinase